MRWWHLYPSYLTPCLSKGVTIPTLDATQNQPKENPMPLFEFRCQACNTEMELLVLGSQDQPQCTHCGSTDLTKLMAAHSSASGPSTQGAMPGLGDTACCGSAPGQKTGCAGPGSCCGRTQ